eukprot:m.78057 g.78057  ORF g.78057 m.78057 type:complete len:71 (+) comp20720_c0_seq1:83-295(+)
MLTSCCCLLVVWFIVTFPPCSPSVEQYVMDVLLPETLIRIFMHVLQVPYESAEELLETAVFGHEDVDVDD